MRIGKVFGVLAHSRLEKVDSMLSHLTQNYFAAEKKSAALDQTAALLKLRKKSFDHPLIFFTSSVSAGMTSKISPTMP